jgi:hypothetical protein
MNEKLIARYREWAKIHGEGTVSGDFKSANKAYKKLTAILEQLSSECCDEELFRLYLDDDPWVQNWAAVHTLEIDEQRASRKLQELVDAKIPLLSSGARYTLAGWRAGELQFRRGDDC